jgi:hypothetical protein
VTAGNGAPQLVGFRRRGLSLEEGHGQAAV